MNQSCAAFQAMTGKVMFGTPAVPMVPPTSIEAFGGPWGGSHFYAQAKNPAPTYGINPGESLTVRFDLTGTTYGALVMALRRRR